MRNLYKQLAFGLIAATSPLAMQAQVEVPDTVYKQLFTEKVADCMKNTMTVIDADGSSKTWGNDTESGNGYAVNIMAGTIVDADDWLITPDIALEATPTASRHSSDKAQTTPPTRLSPKTRS